MAKEPEDIVVPVIREQAHVSTVAVQTGAVRVIKSREEREELIEQELRKGHAEVKRVPVHRIVDGPQPARREESTLIVPVVSEILNGCEKQWVVTEEVRVTQRETAETVQHKVPVATEQVRVERVDQHGQVSSVEDSALPAPARVAVPTSPPAVAAPEAPATVVASKDSILEKRDAQTGAGSSRRKVLSSTKSILRDRLPDRRS